MSSEENRYTYRMSAQAQADARLIMDLYPDLEDNLRRVLDKALQLVARGIVLEPTAEERRIVAAIQERVPAARGRDAAAISWALSEWQMTREGGGGRREMMEEMLPLIRRIAEKLEVDA